MRRVPFIAAFAVSAALAVPSPAQDAASTLILDDAIRLALGHNRSLKVVSYGRGISRANLLVAQGQFDPSLAFNRSSSGTRSAASLGQVQLDDIRADYYSAALQGQLPVGTLYSVTASTQDVRDMYSGFARNYQTFGGFTVTQPLLKGFGFDANLEAVRSEVRRVGDWSSGVCSSDLRMSATCIAASQETTRRSAGSPSRSPSSRDSDSTPTSRPSGLQRQTAPFPTLPTASRPSTQSRMCSSPTATSSSRTTSSTRPKGQGLSPHRFSPTTRRASRSGASRRAT